MPDTDVAGTPKEYRWEDDAMNVDAGHMPEPSDPAVAGVLRNSGSATVGWVWECSLCDERGAAHFSDGASANLMNHIGRELHNYYGVTVTAVRGPEPGRAGGDGDLSEP